MIVHSARACFGRSRAEEPRRRWLYRAWRLVVEYLQYTTSDIIVTTCEIVAVVHRRPCLQCLACCSVNSRQAQNRDFCIAHLHSTPPLGGFSSEYRRPVWYRTTRMVWLPDGEKISKISFFVLTQLTNVTDTQTDTAWRHRPRLCIASRDKNTDHLKEVLNNWLNMISRELMNSAVDQWSKRLWLIGRSFWRWTHWASFH